MAHPHVLSFSVRFLQFIVHLLSPESDLERCANAERRCSDLSQDTADCWSTDPHHERPTTALFLGAPKEGISTP